MVEILNHLFTPEMPSTDSDQEVSNWKILQTAFSILVSVPMVKKKCSQIKSVSYEIIIHIHVLQNICIA